MSTTASSRHKITLRPAQRSDIPAFISISRASFENDTHTQLKGLAQDPPVTASEYMSQGADDFFLSQFGRPGATITAATLSSGDDDDDADPVGFLVTGSRAISNSPEQNLSSYPQTLQSRGSPPSSPDPSTASGTVKDLALITDNSMRDWMSWFLTPAPSTREARCYFVISMSVHPDHQSRGIGSALMGDLARKCDAANVPCWVQSSDGGSGFYGRHGFVEMGRLELELDRFGVAEDGRRVGRPLRDHVGGGGDKWGMYCWRYMERPPRSAGDEV